MVKLMVLRLKGGKTNTANGPQIFVLSVVVILEQFSGITSGGTHTHKHSTILICDAQTDLRVEEDFWPQEALVAHVDGELLLTDGVDARVLFDPLGAVRVVFIELFDQIRTHVAETLLTKKRKKKNI